MRRKYKLIIIILISGLLTYLIYFFNREEELQIVALGDGISSGETSYNIDGISYNDYLKDYFSSKKLLKSYDDNYASKNYKISELVNDIKSNVLDEEKDLYIKQVLHQADLITICFGEEELVRLAMTNDLDSEILKKIINEYDNLLYLLKDISDANIMIISFYENNYLDKSDIIILNAELSNIAIKYEATFINISDLMTDKDYFLDNKELYFNYKGHQKIADMIIHSL